MDTTLKCLLLQKKMPKKKERIIYYRTYSVKEKKISKMEAEEIEKALKGIWKEIKYLNKGLNYGTIEIHFRNAATIWMHPTTSLTTDDLVLLPLYMEKMYFQGCGRRYTS